MQTRPGTGLLLLVEDRYWPCMAIGWDVTGLSAPRIRPRVVACGQLHQIHENSEDIQETYRLAGHAGGYEQAY